jgi:transcriptional regulator with XRE-family HTH domain
VLNFKYNPTMEGVTMLKDTLDAALVRKRLSVRSAAKEIGVSHTTVNRILAGGPFDLETAIKIAAWMGVKLSALLDAETGNDDEIVEFVPGLKGALMEARLLIQSGDAPTTILDDITAFTRFKVSEYRKDANKA